MESPPSNASLLWFLVVQHRKALIRAAALFVGLFAVMFFGSMALDAPRAPWLRSFGLWPTLTGHWQGQLATADGPVTSIYLELGGVVRRRSSHISGKARWCDERGEIRDYTISGHPENWRGSRFYLSLSSVADRDAGASPGELRGEWQGDEIRAAGIMLSHSRVATATATRSSGPAAPPQVVYKLRRGTEEDFLAACAGSRKDAP